VATRAREIIENYVLHLELEEIEDLIEYAHDVGHFYFRLNGYMYQYIARDHGYDPGFYYVDNKGVPTEKATPVFSLFDEALEYPFFDGATLEDAFYDIPLELHTDY